jgi:hypothetical protein
LLDVVEADGDFDCVAPTSPEAEAGRVLLESSATEVLAHLARELTRVYRSRASVAVQGLWSSKVWKRGGWAGFGINAQDGTWLVVALRSLWSAAPGLRIDYWPYSDWRAKRRLEAAHRRLVSRYGFEECHGYFRSERPVPDLSGASVEVAAKTIGTVLESLIRSGVFEVAIERIERDFG